MDLDLLPKEPVDVTLTVHGEDPWGEPKPMRLMGVYRFNQEEQKFKRVDGQERFAEVEIEDVIEWRPALAAASHADVPDFVARFINWNPNGT